MARHDLTCYEDDMMDEHHDPKCPMNNIFCPLMGGMGYIDEDEIAPPTPPPTEIPEHNHDDKYAPKTHPHMFGEIAGLYTHHHKGEAYTKAELKNILENIGQTTFAYKLKCYKPMGTLNYPNQWVHDEHCKKDSVCPLNGGNGNITIDIDTNTYSKAQIDSMLANGGGGSGTGDVNLSNYYTKNQADSKFYDKETVDKKVQSNYYTISKALRDRVKIMLNISLTSSSFDDVIDGCISISAGLIARYIGMDTVPSELEFVLVECSIIRYSRIGSEGLTREGLDGYSADFIVDMLSPFHTYLDDYIARNSQSCNSVRVLRTL